MDNKERKQEIEILKMMRGAIYDILKRKQEAEQNNGDYSDERTEALTIHAAKTYNALLRTQRRLEREAVEPAFPRLRRFLKQISSHL